MIDIWVLAVCTLLPISLPYFVADEDEKLYLTSNMQKELTINSFCVVNTLLKVDIEGTSDELPFSCTWTAFELVRKL